MPNRKAVVELFLVSALGLFAEMVFIRWIASELRVVAFYKNLALLGAYLGLGLGFAWHRRKPDAGPIRPSSGSRGSRTGRSVVRTRR